MSTPAAVIVPSTLPEGFKVIIVNGDGYPNDLGNDLTHITTLQEAQELVSLGNMSYFDLEQWKRDKTQPKLYGEPSRYYRKATDPRLAGILHQCTYVYRFNPKNNRWYLLVKDYGWVKFQHSDERTQPFRGE